MLASCSCPACQCNRRTGSPGERPSAGRGWPKKGKEGSGGGGRRREESPCGSLPRPARWDGSGGEGEDKLSRNPDVCSGKGDRELSFIGARTRRPLSAESFSDPAGVWYLRRMSKYLRTRGREESHLTRPPLQRTARKIKARALALEHPLASGARAGAIWFVL